MESDSKRGKREKKKKIGARYRRRKHEEAKCDWIRAGEKKQEIEKGMMV